MARIPEVTKTYEAVMTTYYTCVIFNLLQNKFISFSFLRGKDQTQESLNIYLYFASGEGHPHSVNEIPSHHGGVYG